MKIAQHMKLHSIHVKPFKHTVKQYWQKEVFGTPKHYFKRISAKSKD